VKKYTREDLIKICEQAFVSENLWHDRDSESSQSKLGECYALLRDGCEFEVVYKDNMCETDDNTIWLYVYSKGFMYYESVWGNETPEELKSYKEKKHFYLPTQKRLDEVKGKDWY
jgi:hypothetical protein